MARFHFRGFISAALIAFTLFVSPIAFGQIRCLDLFLTASESSPYATYRKDTLRGLEVMRNQETGLIQDKIVLVPQKKNGVSIRVMNPNTSATNIGLDLLIQVGLLAEGHDRKQARFNIERTLIALEKMPFHRDSGLFFSWYETGGKINVANADVSSVDNIHLALALWTVKETFPRSTLAERSGRLFDRMDFSQFYKFESGLMGGNMKYENGLWVLERYEFANLGSEARSIYALCWALGLLRKIEDADMPKKSAAALKAEIYEWKPNGINRPFLRTWDAGVFQRVLSDLLVGEQKYAPQFGVTLKNYSDYLIADGERRGIPGKAYHSASQFGYDNGGAFTQGPAYEGKAGTPETVSTDHVDVNDPVLRARWNQVLTPHAAVILAPTDPITYVEILSKMKTLRSGQNLMYRTGFGFMDGYHVKGVYQGQVVPIQISLNQAMIALALEKIAAPDGMTASERALKKNAQVTERLQQFYGPINRKLTDLMEKDRR